MRLTALTKFSKSDLKPGEKILLRVRRHWVAFLVTVIGPLVITLIGLVVTGALIWFEVLNFTSDIANIVLWVVVLAVLGKYIFLDILGDWIDWRYDEDIVTTERIIDVNQHYLFGKDVGVADLDKVEDISLRHEGILSTIFNYGDIEIRTAGTVAAKPGKTFHMQDAPNPLKIQKVISEAVLSFRERIYQQEGRGRRAPVDEHGHAPGERVGDITGNVEDTSSVDKS